MMMIDANQRMSFCSFDHPLLFLFVLGNNIGNVRSSKYLDVRECLIHIPVLAVVGAKFIIEQSCEHNHHHHHHGGMSCESMIACVMRAHVARREPWRRRKISKGDGSRRWRRRRSRRDVWRRSSAEAFHGRSTSI